jgi:cytosine/adenosine deaminase-related metal-dependent hydrolase
MFLLKAKYVVTNPALREEGLLHEAGILVEGSLIQEVGSFDTLRKRYPEATILGSDRHMALPGFVNAHNHGQGATTFLRGTIDNRLETWCHFWPARSVRSDDEAFHDVLVANSREIRSGITASMRHDTPTVPLPVYRAEIEAIIRAYQTSGLRFRFALGTTDQFRLVYDQDEKFIATLPPEIATLARKAASTGDRITIEQFLDYFEELVKRFSGDSRINLVMAVIGPQWDSDALLVRLRDKARELGTGMHGPFLETIYQKLYCEREFGCSGGEHFYRLGILGPDYSCAHGVWLTEGDLDRFAETGATVVHCPSSNLRLYSGIAPVPLMLAKGVNVALAPDSEGINDDDDMFQEMRLAMMLHRQPGFAGEAPDEWDVLKMATMNGAKALLLEDRIGTLEPGKEADIILVNLDRILLPYKHPSIGPVTALVYLGKPRDVEMVMVAGDVIYSEGRFTRFDLAKVEARYGSMMATAYQSEDWDADSMPAELLDWIRKYYENWPIPELDPVYTLNSRC